MSLHEIWAQKEALQVWKPWNGQDILVLSLCIQLSFDSRKEDDN